MAYRFSSQASLALFSTYFLLYGRDSDLLATIHRESSEMMNLDDPNLWERMCFQRATFFWRVMPVAFKNLAIVQHMDMLRSSGEKFIDHQFVGSMWWTNSIYSRLQRLHWMWRRDALSCECKKCYLLEFPSWSVMTVLFGRIMCTTMRHVIFQMCMFKWTQAW